MKKLTSLDKENVKQHLLFRAENLYGRGLDIREDEGLIPGYIKRTQRLLKDLIKYLND